MFRHCIYCLADFGSNEAVEHFPVGSRIAFDGARGRLWAVCVRCRRWNLSPIERRWEALEECEQLFRGTRLRFSTDQIALARLASGVELVRIGAPARPEMAAWRYGRLFGTRRRRALLHGGAAAGIAGGLIVGGPLIGAATASLFVTSMALNVLAVSWKLRAIQRIPGPAGENFVIGPDERPHIRLVPAPGKHGWQLELPYLSVEPAGAPRRPLREMLNLPSLGRVRLEGDVALRAAGLVLPRINSRGASRERVESAVSFLDQTGGAEEAFRHAAANTRRWGAEQRWGDTGAIRFLPGQVRLALEMAAHEDQERRAMEGELRQLELAWREAEELAAIADDLLLPEAVERALARIRQGRTEPRSDH